MDVLIGKMTNLAYDFFGIFVPGATLMLFLVITGMLLGASLPVLTEGVVPPLDVMDSWEKLYGLQSLLLGVLAPGLAFTYFSGHLIFWISRGPLLSYFKKYDGENFGLVGRVALSLIFCLPKPKSNYHSNLDSIYSQCKSKLDSKGTMGWFDFFPVAKILLAESLSHSMVPTYQIKYTLHRSIATAASMFFWLLTAIAVADCVSDLKLISHALSFAVFLCLSLLFVALFSSSYQYNWKMFGNTIISETYFLLFVKPHANGAAQQLDGG